MKDKNKNRSLTVWQLPGFGYLSLLILALSFSMFACRGNSVYSMEEHRPGMQEAKTLSAAVQIQTETETESDSDGKQMQPVAVQTESGSDGTQMQPVVVQTESGSDEMEADLVANLKNLQISVDLPENIRKELESLDYKEVSDAVMLIEKILLSDDFQSLFSYDEVRDLTITLIHNSLDFAYQEPELTNRILETLGINRRVILVLYGLLESREQNKYITEGIRLFLESDKGNDLIDLLMKYFNEEDLSLLLKNAVPLLDSEVAVLQEETEDQTEDQAAGQTEDQTGVEHRAETE